MNDAFHTYLPDKPHCTLKSKLITVKEITDIINNLKPKSSSGIDELSNYQLSNKVIKHIQEIIAEPLTFIINQMILYKSSVSSPFSDRVGLPPHNAPFPGALIKSIGAAFLRPDALSDVNHMRRMQYQIVLNIIIFWSEIN